jgi:hypothetical protein
MSSKADGVSVEGMRRLLGVITVALMLWVLVIGGGLLLV